MSHLNALSDPQALPQALACVGELEQLLEQEFEALKAQELDRFEALVQTKTDMLHQLGSITGIQDKRSEEHTSELQSH